MLSASWFSYTRHSFRLPQSMSEPSRPSKEVAITNRQRLLLLEGKQKVHQHTQYTATAILNTQATKSYMLLAGEGKIGILPSPTNRYPGHEDSKARRRCAGDHKGLAENGCDCAGIGLRVPANSGWCFLGKSKHLPAPHSQSLLELRTRGICA